MELIYQNMIFGSEEEIKIKKWCLYTASMEKLELKERDDIQLIEAKHHPSLNKTHVRAVYITNSKILFVPRIENHFTQLVVLHIANCGLQEISKCDLQPFKSLKILQLSHNAIQSLPHDLFGNTHLIEQLHFQSNKIRFISQYTLTPLLNLDFADFRHNITINEVYSSEGFSVAITLPELKVKILQQCKPSNEQISTVSSYVHNLWEGAFSDFKIKAREEVFSVHKAVLVVNSPVFAAMFSHQMEENVTNEMTIANFCPETIKEFLAFVYLRKIPEKCCSATDLYAMAEEYQVKELSSHIQWLIVFEVNIENASEMFKFGVLYDNEVIKQAAFQQIETFLNRKLPKDLMKSSENMMELLEAKDKLDEVVKRADQTYCFMKL